MTRHLIHRRPALSGILIWGICSLIGAGVLWISITYANQQRDEALHANLERQYEALVKSCGRGNKLRVRLNVSSGVLHDFLVTARTARVTAAKIAPTKAERDLNAKAARKYSEYLQQLQPIPLTDCAEAYPKP